MGAVSQPKELVPIVLRHQGGEDCFKIRKGAGLQALAAKERVAIEFDCRKADCGICLIKVHHGSESLSSPTVAEKDFLQAMGADDNERLACQCRVYGSVCIEVEPVLL